MRIKTPRHNWQNYCFGSISLCMIMRDSAKTLRRCLNSVVELVDEIIIVDTGSVDNSIEIAKSYRARVLRDPWQNDFARPRNIGLKQAQSQWILIMDPDETLSQEHHIEIKWLTRAEPYVSFLLTTFNYSAFSRDAKYRLLPEGKDPTGRFPGYTPSTKTRFFKNGLGIKFEGCWHELVDWSVLRKKLKVGKSLIPIHHWTHEFEQKSWPVKKAFYLKMGEKKVREWPRSGKAWWELSVPEMSHGYFVRAKHSIAKAIQFGFADGPQFFALAQCHRHLKNKEKADYSFEKGTCKIFPSLTHIDPAKKTLVPLLEEL